MRSVLAALVVGTFLASGCATLPDGQPSKLEVAAERAAKDLLGIGKELAKQGARDACVVLSRTAFDALRELSKYAALLPSPEDFCDTFISPSAPPEVEPSAADPRTLL